MLYVRLNNMRILVQSLIRIFGIFYCVKALDTSAGSIYAYIFQRSSYGPELADQMPNPLLLLLPTMFLYLLIAFGVFFSAPLLSKWIVPQSKDTDMECGALDIAVITSSALLISGWVFTRIIDQIYVWVAVYKNDGEFSVSDAEGFYLLTNLTLLLACFLMIKRMPNILKHFKNRCSEQDAAPKRG